MPLYLNSNKGERFKLRTLDSVVPPVTVSDQTLTFGALTRAGHGGVIPSHSGTIASASITKGNESGHWQISTDGTITPTSVGQTAGLSGPYVLECEFGDGTESVQATIAVETEIDTYSVSTVNQLVSVGNLSALSFGQTIKLRAGEYGTSTRIKRSVPIQGTFIPPVDKVPSHNGPDLFSANYVRIAAYDSSKTIISGLDVDGINTKANQFLFDGLTFRRYLTEGINPEASGILKIHNSADALAFHKCKFQSTPNDVFNQRWNGIYSNNSTDIKVIDCEFDDCFMAMVGASSGFDFIGNTIRRCWNDALKMTSRGNQRVNWNTVIHKKHPPSEYGAHADFFQWVGGAWSADGFEVIGNVLVRGEGTDGLSDGQGIFIDDTREGYNLTNVKIIGNLYVGSFVRGISVTRAIDPVVKWNTILSDRELQHNIGIHFSECVGGDISYNITESIGIPVDATANGNILASRKTSGDLSYESLFEDPQSGASVTDPLSQFAIKQSSVAYLTDPRSGAIGTGYVDYINRTLNAPDELIDRVTISQYGITWTLGGSPTVGQFANGDYYVVDSGSGVEVQSVSPAPSNGRNGSIKNPAVGSSHPFDDRAGSYDESLATQYPTTLYAGDCLLSSISRTEETSDWGGRNIDSQSQLKTVAVLTVLRQAPPEGTLRPSYVDRTQTLYNINNIDQSVLPNNSASGLPAPRLEGSVFENSPLEYFKRGLERPWILFVHEWPGRAVHPFENMRGYHREVGTFLSELSTYLVSDLPKDNELLARVVQFGIDFYHVGVSGNGDSSYWVMPTLLAGRLLNDSEMLNAFTTGQIQSVPRDYPDFYLWEDKTATTESDIVPAGRTWNGWTAFFKNSTSADREYEHLHPSEWGQGGTNGRVDDWKDDSYRRSSDSHTHVGMVFSAQLLGLESNWAHPATFAYVDRWMVEDHEANFAVMSQYADSAGNYAVDAKDWNKVPRSGSSFVDAMWDAYNTRDVPVPVTDDDDNDDGDTPPPADWYPTDLGSRLEALWDCNDHSTLFQDDAGTLPVTGILQPVGLLLDKSGHGRHLQQVTAASRPELRAHPKAYGETIFELDELPIVQAEPWKGVLSFPVSTSKQYQISFDADPGSTGVLQMINLGTGGHQVPLFTGGGTFYSSTIWKPTSGTGFVQTLSGGFYGTLRNIKVREITEWHNHYLYFDGVDDSLIDQGQWAQAVPFPMAHAIAFRQDPTSGTGNTYLFERGTSHLRHHLQLRPSAGAIAFTATGGTDVSIPGDTRDGVARRVIANPHLGTSKIRVNGADTEWENSGGYALQTMAHSRITASYKGAIYTHAVFTGSMIPDEFDTVDDWLLRRSS